MSTGKMWVLVALLLLGIGGCSAVIVPPRTTTAAGGGGGVGGGGQKFVPVAVADYGYHSTLILPRAEGGLVEYAYGDWDYFGQSHKSVANALHALLASDQATLGRRVLEMEPTQSGLEKATGASQIIRFTAPREKVEELERELDRRFSARLDSIMYSPVHQLYFVKDDERYGVGHNCNHFTAQWLERLGCRVEGVVLGSGFRLKEGPAEEEAAPAPTAATGTALTASLRATTRGSGGGGGGGTTTQPSDGNRTTAAQSGGHLDSLGADSTRVSR
ncbi:MAG TPA: hypothetical protein VH475_20530 [Tepidisphaeraceae bacterium]|jgi:hypothetical protein